MQMTIPNVLSLARIAAAPFLLLAGYYGSEDLFFILFSLMLISDMLDGYLARKLHQCSKIGSRLDSIGDYLTYLSVPFATWWLWPEIIKAEAFYITAVITLFLLPGIIGLIKFHQ
ncbi:CDP-alcohol phosphatidyltransferase family protein, partial [bacterium]|nr:CDP-alcohol phosphatidyltransferase family protein [bacterium]